MPEEMGGVLARVLFPMKWETGGAAILFPVSLARFIHFAV